MHDIVFFVLIIHLLVIIDVFLIVPRSWCVGSDIDHHGESPVDFSLFLATLKIFIMVFKKYKLDVKYGTGRKFYFTDYF